MEGVYSNCRLCRITKKTPSDAQLNSLSDLVEDVLQVLVHNDVFYECWLSADGTLPRQSVRVGPQVALQVETLDVVTLGTSGWIPETKREELLKLFSPCIGDRFFHLNLQKKKKQ